jgi:hypothetical protein
MSKVPSFLFGQPASNSAVVEKASEPPNQTPKPLSDFAQSTQPQQEGTSLQAPGLFGAPPASSGGLFTPMPAKTTSMLETSVTPTPAKSTSESEPAVNTASASAVSLPAPERRNVYTKSPSRPPQFLNAEGYMEYDKNYRLRALNKRFQDQIAAIDTDRYDVENIIRHYAAARAMIGGDMGLYQRTAAGTKRKQTEVNESEIPPEYRKKARVEKDGDLAKPAPVPAPQAIQKATPAPAPQPIPKAAPPNMSSFFSNNAPKHPASAPPATNPFASVPYLQQKTTPAKGPLFGNSFSTTPAKSPGSPLEVSSSPSISRKRKSTPDDDDEEQSRSEDERKKRNRTSTGGKDWNLAQALNSRQTEPISSSSEEDEPEESGTRQDSSEDEFAPNADDSDGDDEDLDDDEESSEDEPEQKEPNGTLQEDSEASSAQDEDRVSDLENNPNKGKSLFDRISVPDSRSESALAPAVQPPATTMSNIMWPKPSGLTPEAPEYSPITPASTSPYKPTSTFNYTPTPAVKPAAGPGASVLEGGRSNGIDAKFQGMFGSRPSTPEPEKASAGPTSTPGADHTWKKGQEIKFQVTDATPVKDGDSSKQQAASAIKSNNFLGFGFGRPVNSPLASGSVAGSVNSSRGASPAITTDNESNATDDVGASEETTEPQQDLMDENPGEENEDLLYECKTKPLVMAVGERAKQLKVKERTWTPRGMNRLRILKDRTTGRVRVVIRREPGASITVNSYLFPDEVYEVRDQGEKASGAVSARFQDGEYMDAYVLKVSTKAMAEEISGLLNKHKKDGQ